MFLSPEPLPMRLLCPAKVNLHLRVGPCRADGFHPLLSWMCTVGLFDTLILGLSGGRLPVVPSGTDVPGRGAPPGETGKLAGAAASRPAPEAAATGGAGGLPIALECTPADLPCDDTNLVVRVAKAWRPKAGADGVSIQARLIKQTPVGAGLGGGSSDAARMILALNRLAPNAGASTAGELAAFAARFGSDVPFFLAGPSSVCSGRGEIVRPIAKPCPKWAVLVLPELMMPTPEVYRRFDELGLGRLEDIEQEPDWSQWAALDALSLLPRLVNDLEAPAFAIRPDLGELRRAMERQLGRPVRMSGSGSSLFTLFDDADQARFATQTLSQVPSRVKARIEAVGLAPTVQDDLNT